jgi:hypothetical protein
VYSIILTLVCSITLLSVSAVHASQDPMRPPNWVNRVDVPSTKKEVINLQQILISDKRKTVIVNGQIFKEGQSFNGNRIIEIEAEQIKIRRRGVNKIIKLLPSTKGVSREI